MRIYQPGTIVSLRCEIVRRGRPVDPERISLIVNAPNRGRHGRHDQELVYGEDEEISRLGPGRYQVDLKVQKTGEWFYTWLCEPRPALLTQRRFLVQEPDE